MPLYHSHSFYTIPISSLSQNELLETVSAALVAFFSAQQGMLDQVPQLGHIPQLFRAMTSRDDAVPASAVAIVLALADSTVS